MASRASIYAVLSVGAFIAVGPCYYIIRISLESSKGYLDGSPDLSLSSWSAAIEHSHIIAYTAHSAIVTLISVGAIGILSLLAGYGFAKLRPRRAGGAFIVIVAGFMIPLQSIAVPLYLDFAQVRLIGSYPGAIAVYTALYLPFSVFLMTSFFRGLPSELLEAGLLDGLGYIGVLIRVLLPLAAPALVAVGVLAFIAIWNDLLVAMLWLPSPSVRTVTTGVATLSGMRIVPVPEIMAASVIQAVPAVVVFMLFQRHMARGLTLGSGR